MEGKISERWWKLEPNTLNPKKDKEFPSLVRGGSKMATFAKALQLKKPNSV